jgi:DNA repair exonuclease SbcCD nuclease subunit
MVKKIYQIADIHIPTYQKLNMYSEQLDNYINYVMQNMEEENLSSDEVRIVLCGDLVHSKNLVTNELNVLASTFIRQLSQLAKVICIAGNHDLIESNTSRVDTLSGIFKTAQFDNAVFLDMELDYESGIVYDDNITWALYSFFDDFKSPDLSIARETYPENKIIGLFHGMIVGSKLYNGFVADNGTDATLFDGCDAVMAGHIHKRQVIRCNGCDIVYAGSPIQQNYGESITQHGCAVWDMQTLEHEFVDLPSEYGYYDISITGIDDLKEDREKLLNL